MLSTTFTIFIPFIIAGILQFGSDHSIVKKSEQTVGNIKKIRFLQYTRKGLNIVILSVMLILDTLSDYPDSDILNLFDGKGTYDIVSLLSNVDSTKVNYYMILAVPFCIAIIIPILFFTAGIVEKKDREDFSLGKLIKASLIRVFMFSLGAFVVLFSLAVLFKTPTEMIAVNNPFMKHIEYSIILLCVFINFRFQIKADRDEEKNPHTLGCISICCSAVWCSFVYSVFAIAFLFSFSTFIHIDSFVVDNGIYLFILGNDCRIHLLLSSIIYGLFFIITSRGGFRAKYWPLFALYIISAFVFFLYPMLYNASERLLIVLAFLLLSVFFLLFYFKIIKQAKVLNGKSKDVVEDIPEKWIFLRIIETLKNINPEPWSCFTFGTSVLIVLVAAIFPFVEQF